MPNAQLVEKASPIGTVDVSGVAALVGGAINQGYAVWDRDFSHYGAGNELLGLPFDWTSFPSSITLHFALNASGDFYCGAESQSAADALAVLTEEGLSSRLVNTWGHPTQAGSELHSYLSLDTRANVLVRVMWEELLPIAEAGLVTGGLEVLCAQPYGCQWGKALIGFDSLDFALLNNYSQPIHLLLTVIHMTQMQTQWACGCPFDGVPFSQGPGAALQDALNLAWNPKPDPAANGTGTRGLTLASSGVSEAFLTAHIDGDNANSGWIKLNGSTVTSFLNWNSGPTYRVAGQVPSSIEMSLTNDWSWSNGFVWIAALGGSISFSGDWETPGGGLDGNPPPLTYDLQPGWNLPSDLPGPNIYWTEIAAHLAGSFGSQWRTDLVTRNISTSPADVVITLHTATGEMDMTATVDPSAQGVFEDVVALMGVEDKGALEVCSTQPLKVLSRIYNQAATGTFGQLADGYTSADGLAQGQSAWLYGLRQKEGQYRTNLSVTNTGAVPASVKVTLYTTAATRLMDYTFSVGAAQVYQDTEPFKDRAGQPDLGWGMAEVEVLSGSGVLTSASVIDSRTNGATTIPMKW